MGDADEQGGPGAVYMQYALMEGVSEKLKLLDYEKLFCKELGFKPFPRYILVHLSYLTNFII